MANYLNIPKEIIIGKKNNQAFITYKQGSKIAKEISFKNWLGDGEQIDATNSPRKGFILQDCVGGHGGSWYSYERRAWAIIKDPRGFNIEITFDNLVWIMKMVSHDHNTGFDGEFVYGWDGSQLMLVPTVSKDYTYTTNIDNKETYKLKDLVIGETYRFPNEHNMIYLGYLPVIKLKDKYMYGYQSNTEYATKKFHCFHCPYDPYKKFITVSSTKKKIIKDDAKPVQTKEWIDEKIDIELKNVPFSVQWMKREELKIKFKKEFKDNAKRTIMAYRSQTWRIEDNKIMVTNHEDFHYHNLVDAIELLNKNKNRIALTNHYTDNFFDVFLIETKDGFVFQVNK